MHPRIREASSKLRDSIGQYRQSHQSLKSASSTGSRHGLDWTNFFLADVQTGFGTYVAFYLAQQNWSRSDVGLALTVGGLAGVLSQIPGGALCDALNWKCGLIASGIVAIGVAALILAFHLHSSWFCSQSWSCWSPNDVPENRTKLSLRRWWSWRLRPF